MLIATFSRWRTLVNAMLVSWLPWSVLKISGAPKRVSASSNASMQKSVSSVIDSRQLSTRRLNQSTMQGNRVNG
jgi:hypothetical protein